MANESIFPGIVENRRKIYSPNKEDGSSAGRWKDEDISLHWRIRQLDSDIAHLKNQMVNKDKLIDDLQVKFNLVHTLVGNL